MTSHFPSNLHCEMKTPVVFLVFTAISNQFSGSQAQNQPPFHQFQQVSDVTQHATNHQFYDPNLQAQTQLSDFQQNIDLGKSPHNYQNQLNTNQLQGHAFPQQTHWGWGPEVNEQVVHETSYGSHQWQSHSQPICQNQHNLLETQNAAVGPTPGFQTFEHQRQNLLTTDNLQQSYPQHFQNTYSSSYANFHATHPNFLQSEGNPGMTGNLEPQVHNSVEPVVAGTGVLNYRYDPAHFQNWIPDGNENWPAWNPGEETMDSVFSPRILPNQKPRSHLQNLRIEAQLRERESRRHFARLQEHRRRVHEQWRREYRRHTAEWRRYQERQRKQHQRQKQYGRRFEQGRTLGQNPLLSHMTHAPLRKEMTAHRRKARGRRRLPFSHVNALSRPQHNHLGKLQGQQQRHPASIQEILQQQQSGGTAAPASNHQFVLNPPQYSYAYYQYPHENSLISQPQYSHNGGVGGQLGQPYQTIDLTENSNQVVVWGGQQTQHMNHPATHPPAMPQFPHPLNQEGYHKSVPSERGLILRPSALALTSAGVGTLFSGVWEVMEMIVGSISLFLYVIYSAVSVPLG